MLGHIKYITAVLRIHIFISDYYLELYELSATSSKNLTIKHKIVKSVKEEFIYIEMALK